MIKLHNPKKINIGLNLTGTRILNLLSKNYKYNTKDLSNILNLDLSTVQRYLKRLYELDYLILQQRNKLHGGFEYYYKIK